MRMVLNDQAALFPNVSSTWLSAIITFSQIQSLSMDISCG